MKLLDLYSCGGGASYGYSLAGFEVTGVDIVDQKNYPFTFIQADVLTLDLNFLKQFDVIHASPPCQFATVLRFAPNGKNHPNLIPATKELLIASEKPYIIENVEAAREHLIDPILLCGSMFKLGAAGHQLRRHRLFESNLSLSAPNCQHTNEPVIGVYGAHIRCRSAKHGGRQTKDFVGQDKVAIARETMGMPWANMSEMSEAIPPAYTEYLGKQIKSLI